MRVDSLSPKTWLLAGIAGWGVCLWLFALFGLGGRIGDTDGELPEQKLPTTRIPAVARPGPQAQYAEIGTRPVFSENRRPQPFVIPGAGAEVQANTFDYTLTSVLLARDLQLAILKPAADGAPSVRVKVGEAVETAPQWTLATLQPRQAVFRGPEGEKVLDLRVFNGIGGAMPPVPPPGSAPVASAAGPAGGVINETPPGAPGNEVPGPQGPPQMAGPPPPPGPGGAAGPPAAATAPVSTEAQLEAIRRRIEARRAQLRQQAAQEARNAGSTPGQTP
jgi:general secretion pathway protein N